MGLFYLTEHTSCHLYAKCIKEGFSIKKIPKGKVCEEVTARNTIVFVMSGTIEFACGDNKYNIRADNMFSLQQGVLYRINPVEDSYIIISQFERMVDSCEKLVLTNLAKINMDGKDPAPYLPICHNLRLFLNLLAIYLEDGANCVHFHEIKMKELFWVLRFYYTKEQLAGLFSYLLGANYNFRSLVLKNYTRVKSVKELAAACGYSLASFKREFDKEFGEPAGQWLQKNMVNIIKYRLLDETIPLCNIADELNFSSMSYFTRYCKQKFGYTPKEYRTILKKNHIAGNQASVSAVEPNM